MKDKGKRGSQKDRRDRRYYQRHREEILRKLRERYATDPVYRAKKRKMERESRQRNLESRRKRDREYHARNRDRILERSRVQRLALTPEQLAQRRCRERERYKRTRIAQLCRKYNITRAQYDRLLQRSQGQCELCGQRTKLCIDHNHKTGRVRGLLCKYCNVALGLIESRGMSLQCISRYLRRKGI